VHGYDAEQVTAWCAQGVGVLPAGDRLRAKGGEPGDLRGQVVGLDVEVVARRVVDRLDHGEQTGDGVVEEGELLLARHGTGRNTQRGGPEVRCRAGLLGGRVDEETDKTTAMHVPRLTVTTPISREEFLIGKALAAFVPALVIAYAVFGCR
jgi:hypothetical protein